MKQFVFILLFLCAPLLAIAADIPQVVNSNIKASKERCVVNAANDCITMVCPNSPDINCSANCQDSAQNKCQGMAEE